MTYRHNSIFKNPKCILGRYIQDIRINVTCESSLHSDRAMPELSLKLIDIKLSTHSFTATVVIFLDSIRVFNETIDIQDISPGELSTISTSSGITLVLIAPMSGSIAIAEESLQPYVAVLNPSNVTKESVIEFPESVVRLEVLQGELYLSIPDDSLQHSFGELLGFTHVNGISPGQSGNINIVSKNPDIRVEVRSIHD